jgi:hypothetical protein
MQRIPLSGDASGKYTPIKLGATAVEATPLMLHTATAVAGEVDDMWLDLVNTSDETVRVTLLKGGSTVPDNIVVAVDISPAGSLPTRVFDGKPITGGATLSAFVDAGDVNKVVVDGWVNRYKAA